jgi:hypothetical protein
MRLYLDVVMFCEIELRLLIFRRGSHEGQDH